MPSFLLVFPRLVFVSTALGVMIERREWRIRSAHYSESLGKRERKREAGTDRLCLQETERDSATLARTECLVGGEGDATSASQTASRAFRGGRNAFSGRLSLKVSRPVIVFPPARLIAHLSVTSLSASTLGDFYCFRSTGPSARCFFLLFLLGSSPFVSRAREGT